MIFTINARFPILKGGANLIEAFIDFLSLFTLDSDEGENKYGPEPWDSKN